MEDSNILKNDLFNAALFLSSEKSGSLSRQTSRGSTGSVQGGQGADVRGRGSSSSLPGQSQTLDGPSPPMMKVIAQLWCHECTRTFADRLVTEEGIYS